MDASRLPRNLSCVVGQARLQFYIRPCGRFKFCRPRWNPLTHASFLQRVIDPEQHSGLVSPGLTYLPSHSITLRNLSTCPSFVTNWFISMSPSSCRFDAHITSLILPIMCQQRPDRSCHLVGQRHGHHIRRPALADLLNPRGWLLRVS